MSKQPKIDIPRDQLDYLLEILTALGAAILIFLPLFYYGSLPDKIPTHFTPAGKPDNFANKSTLWFISAIGIFTYAMMHVLRKIPHRFNYGVKITPENAAQQYRIALRMMQWINAIIVWLLVYLIFQSIQIALENSSQLSPLIMGGFLLLLLGSIFYFLNQSLKDGK